MKLLIIQKFIRNIKNYNSNEVFYFSKKIKIKNANNFFSMWLNFFFFSGLKSKINVFFLKFFIFFFSTIKKNTKLNYPYFIYFKKIISLNNEFLNLNNVLKYLFINFSLLFCFKIQNSQNSQNRLKKRKNTNTNINNTNKIELFYVWYKKRKLFFLKWIKNKINYLKKKNKLTKIIYIFLDLFFNFKNSLFFKFKLLIYKKFLNIS